MFPATGAPLCLAAVAGSRFSAEGCAPRSPAFAPRAAVGRRPTGKAFGVTAVCYELCVQGVGRCAWGKDACGVAVDPRMCTVCPVGKAQEQSAVPVAEGCQGRPRNVTEGEGLSVRKLTRAAGPWAARKGQVEPWRAAGREAAGRRAQAGASGRSRAGVGGLGWRTGRKRMDRGLAGLTGGLATSAVPWAAGLRGRGRRGWAGRWACAAQFWGFRETVQ